MKKNSFLYSTIITSLIFGFILFLLGIETKIIYIILAINLLMIFTFQVLSQRSMKNPKHLLKLGSSLFKKKKYRQALNFLEKAHSIDQKLPPEADKMLGDIYFNGWEIEKNWDKARASYEEILILDSAVNMTLEHYTNTIQREKQKNVQLSSNLWPLIGPVVQNMDEIAQKNDAKACLSLAHWNRLQDQKHKNINKAISYYRKAIELGQKDCLKYLGAALLEKEAASESEINEGMEYLHDSFYKQNELDAGLELWKYYCSTGLRNEALWLKSLEILSEILDKSGNQPANQGQDNMVAAEIVAFCKNNNCLEKLNQSQINILQQLAPKTMKA